MIRYQDQDFFPSLGFEGRAAYEKIPDQQVIAYIAPNGLDRIQLGNAHHASRARRQRV